MGDGKTLKALQIFRIL